MRKLNSIDLGLEIIETVRRPGERMTLEEISSVCLCSCERVRQIEAKALEKLRKRAIELGSADTLDSVLSSGRKDAVRAGEFR